MTMRFAKQDCRDLAIALVLFADHGQRVEAAELFVSDGVWIRSGKAYRGRDEILASFDRPETMVKRHLTMSTHIELLNETSARGTSYYVAYMGEIPPYPSDQITLSNPVAIGEWHDEFRKQDGRWRFARREAKRVFSGRI
jgi:hypothetical protein